jgi:outer membrane protein assembly factor BamB
VIHRAISWYPIILLAFFLLTGPAMAKDPAWSATGGPPVAISADGGYVVSDGESFSLYTSQGEKLWRGFGGSAVLARGGEVFSPLAITRDGKYSILGTDGGLLYLDSSQRIFWQDSQFRPIQGLALTPDENYVASVADGRISVYTRGGELVWRNHTYPDVQYVGISPAGLLTVAGSPDTIHAFNQSGFELWNYTAPGIREIIVSPKNSDIIIASDYTILSLHPSGNLLWSYYTGSEIRDIGISGDGSTIAAGNQGGIVCLFDENGKLLWSYTAGDWINAVSLSGDGSLIAAGGNDRKVYLFERSGRLLWNYTTGGWVKSVAISSDGSGLAAGADMVYYFALQPGSPPGTTSPTATSTGQATPMATPAPSPAYPVGEATTVSPSTTVSVQGTTPRSASGASAFIAPGIIILYFIRRRAS